MILDLEPCAVTRCRTHYVSTSRHRLFADDEVKRDRGGYGLGGYLTVGRFNTYRQRQSNYQRQHRESLNYLVRHFLAPVSAFPALSSSVKLFKVASKSCRLLLGSSIGLQLGRLDPWPFMCHALVVIQHRKNTPKRTRLALKGKHSTFFAVLRTSHSYLIG